MKNLNFCPKTEASKYLPLIIFLGGLVFGCLLPKVFALDPNKSISQFNRQFWGNEEGFSYGTVYAFAQTPDGYLWIGTEKGLIRFDGFKFEIIHPQNTPLPISEPILGLVTDVEGSLWIRFRSPKIIRYKNGKFEDALINLSEVDPRISSMSRSPKGELLFATLENGPLKFTENKVISLIPKSDLPPSFLISIAETASGEVWMGTRESGLFRFDGQETTEFTNNLPDRKVNYLLPDQEKSLWIGTDRGLAFWDGNKLESPDLPDRIKNSQVLTMVKDRQSNLWVGTKANGIIRLDPQGAVSTENIDANSNKIITALFEDREGNLWIGSQLGIERLRDNSFVTYSTNNGLPTDTNGAVFVDYEKRIWFAPISGGLFWLKNDKVEKIKGFDEDVVYSINGFQNDLWIGRQRGGLTHLQFNENGNQPLVRTYTQKDGLAQNSVYTVFLSGDGSVWAGTLSGGVSHLKDGKFTTYTANDGLASNTVNQIVASKDGTVWFATPNGLSSYSNNVWRNFTTSDGLPTESVNCILDSPRTGGLWFGTDKGLAFFDGNRIINFSNLSVLPQEPIFGLGEDKNGDLWISSANHVLQIDAQKLIQGELGERDVREFGLADGLLSHVGVKRSQSVISDDGGRIWFSLERGLSMVSPTRISEYSTPALLKINYFTTDGRQMDLTNPIRISILHQRIIIGFTGISLEIPERVKYRYKLENFDKDWSEPTALKEAVYTNLSPGVYRFHVTATNSHGVWNNTEKVIEFEIVPMFWQTWWFRLLSLALLFLLIFSFFKIREYRLARSLTLRFEERLAERTLLARDLHDSLLQGVVGASMQLSVAIDQTPEDSASKKALSKVLQTMHRVIEEGRNTIRGLRATSDKTSEIDATDLEKSLIKMWEGFANSGEKDFRIIINGVPRPLHPLVQNEVQRIGGEALINTLKHSEAKKVEIEIDYSDRYFRMMIQDDGRGLDSKTLTSEGDGHWGILGMRERAERIRAKLKILSRIGSGTVIEIIVPEKIAYKSPTPNNKVSELIRVEPHNVKSEF